MPPSMEPIPKYINYFVKYGLSPHLCAGIHSNCLNNYTKKRLDSACYSKLGNLFSLYKTVNKFNMFFIRENKHHENLTWSNSP